MKKIAAIVSLSFAAFAFADDADPPTKFAGCERAADFQAATGPTANITPTPDLVFSPKCLRVKAGTEVKILGMPRHPLQGVKQLSGQPANPFFSEGGGQRTEQSHTLNTPGVYGFYCTNHGQEDGTGMAGAIWVE